jgi:hypothetical protein
MVRLTHCILQVNCTVTRARNCPICHGAHARIGHLCPTCYRVCSLESHTRCGVRGVDGPYGDLPGSLCCGHHSRPMGHHGSGRAGAGLCHSVYHACWWWLNSQPPILLAGGGSQSSAFFQHLASFADWYTVLHGSPSHFQCAPLSACKQLSRDEQGQFPTTQQREPPPHQMVHPVSV